MCVYIYNNKCVYIYMTHIYLVYYTFHVIETHSYQLVSDTSIFCHGWSSCFVSSKPAFVLDAVFGWRLPAICIVQFGHTGA